jgi:hypothetical protein
METLPPSSTAVIGAIVGAVVALGIAEWTRRRRARGHWAALRTEIRFCMRMAEVYSRDFVSAPLYRLSTIVFRTSFPALLADAAVKEEAAQSLITFFGEVETINRGLDLVDAARQANDPLRIAQEINRNLLKVKNLQRLYPDALAALPKNLQPTSS